MAGTNQQSIWLDFEGRFRQIPDPYIRADWNRNETDSGAWEDWRVCGSSDVLGIERFEALASLAGQRLWHSSLQPHAQRPNLVHRWLNRIKSEGISFGDTKHLRVCI